MAWQMFLKQPTTVRGFQRSLSLDVLDQEGLGDWLGEGSDSNGHGWWSSGSYDLGTTPGLPVIVVIVTTRFREIPGIWRHTLGSTVTKGFLGIPKLKRIHIIILVVFLESWVGPSNRKQIPWSASVISSKYHWILVINNTGVDLLVDSWMSSGGKS